MENVILTLLTGRKKETSENSPLTYNFTVPDKESKEPGNKFKTF